MSGSNAVGLLPVMVQALSNIPVWAALGDSITAGIEDRTFDPAGGRGIFGRALEKTAPYVNVGSPGDQAVVYLTSSNAANRKTVIASSGATKSILHTGTNDIFSAARTRAQLEAHRKTIRPTTHPGIKWLDATLLPRFTPSDIYQTVASQATPNATYEVIRQRL